MIGNCGRELIEAVAPMGYRHLVPKAYEIEFLYISSSLETARTTPSVRITPTHTYETAPRDQWIYWDLGFVAWGAAMWAGGWLLVRSGRRRTAQRVQASTP